MSADRPTFAMLGGDAPLCVGDECVVPGADAPRADLGAEPTTR